MPLTTPSYRSSSDTRASGALAAAAPHGQQHRHLRLYTPCYGAYAEPRRMAELAAEAERAGWDGVFVSDHLQWLAPAPQPVADPWILLAAMAMTTQRIRLGVLVTPTARRPWKLTRETVMLDHLSGGRLVLGAGIGGDWLGEYSTFGESADDRLHGEQLDEGLAVLDGLWSGEPFSFSGKHYQIKETQFLPQPVQRPRIPVWVGGGWPRTRPLRRAARWDGIVPFSHSGGFSPDDISSLAEAIRAQRADDTAFDIVCYATAVAPDGTVDRATIDQFAAAGATWWLHGLDINLTTPIDTLFDRVRQGP